MLLFSVIHPETTFLSPHYTHKPTSNPIHVECSVMWNHLSVGVLLYKSYWAEEELQAEDKKTFRIENTLHCDPKRKTKTAC